jgi:hypothetical protein
MAAEWFPLEAEAWEMVDQTATKNVTKPARRKRS